MCCEHAQNRQTARKVNAWFAARLLQTPAIACEVRCQAGL